MYYACAAGKYSNVTGTSACHVCPGGKYSCKYCLLPRTALAAVLTHSHRSGPLLLQEAAEKGNEGGWLAVEREAVELAALWRMVLHAC